MSQNESHNRLQESLKLLLIFPSKGNYSCNEYSSPYCLHSQYILPPATFKKSTSFSWWKEKKKKTQYLSRIITNIFTRWIENYSWKKLTLKTWLVTCCLGEIQIRKNSLDILTRTTTFVLALGQLWYRTLYNQKCFQ